MPGLAAALLGAFLLGLLSTLGDFVWARFVSTHRTGYGLVHGTLLLGAVGLYLGALRRRPFAGVLAGGLVGLLAAASFYALAPLLGYWAVFASWAALWVGFALVDARLRGGAPAREWVLRGLAAAVAAGLAFWAISGIWLRPAPGGPNYPYNLLCWTFAFLPGFAALLLQAARSPKTASMRS